MGRRLSALGLAIAALVSLTSAQSGGAAVRLTLTEGTSMAAALSPDGRTIAIDLLGALWTLSADGGRRHADPRGRLRRAHAGVVARWPAASRFRPIAPARGTSGRSIAMAPRCVRRPTAPFDDREPHWSPDGGAHRLLVRSQRQLRRLDADAGDAASCGRSRRVPPTTSCLRGRRTAARSPLCRIDSERGVYAIGLNGARERLHTRRTAPSPRRRRGVLTARP